MTTIVTTTGSNWATLAADRGITGDLVMPDMRKVVVQNKWLIGVAGDIRACDLLQYGVKYPSATKMANQAKSEWFSFIVTKVVPLMKAALKGENEQEFEAILVTYGHSFLITNEFGVLDASPYWAIGSGAKLALGHVASFQYSENWHKNHDLMARQAIEVASMHDINTRGGIDVFVSHHTGHITGE
jgi:ATP-dependent protease HslVU (ClpYQ) peptidase subunit